MELKELLKSLSEASGVSGYEDDVRQLVRDAYAPLCDEMREDAMGNLIGVKHGAVQLIAVLAYFTPVGSAVLIGLLYRETLGAGLVVGALMIVAGAVVSGRGTRVRPGDSG